MMKTPKWICNNCKQTFTRRWNAERHCNNIHDGVIDYIIYFRDYLRQTVNSQLPQNPYGSLTDDTNQLPYHKTLSIQSKRINSHIQSISHDSKSNLTKEKLLYVTMNDLATRYEELENLLSHLPEQNRRWILGGIISRAIYSENPVTFINKELRSWRKAKLYDNMLNNVSIFLGYDKLRTIEFLKMGIN
jgi:hypothetical protein